MSLLKKTNNAKSTLDGGITDSATDLTVADASSFPSSGEFVVTIWDKGTYSDPGDDSNMEIVLVTAVNSGNNFTITRAQEGTTGVAHSDGDAVELLITAGQFDDYLALDGRSGGQSFVGGTSSSDDLTIGANTATFDDKNTGRINVTERMVFDTDFTVAGGTLLTNWLSFTPTITSAEALNGMTGFAYAPVFKPSVAQILSNFTAFSSTPTIRHTSGVTDSITYYSGFTSQPKISPDVSSGSINPGSLTGYSSSPRVARTGTVTATIAEVNGFATYNTPFIGVQDIHNSTVTALTHYRIVAPAKSGSTITNQYGLLIPSLTGATNNYGIYSNMADATNDWFIYANGTAKSVHNGEFRIGDTTEPTQMLEVLGNILIDNDGTAAELRFREPGGSGNNHYTAFKAGTQSADITYTLPTAAPASNGYSLTSTTAGVLSWTNVSGGGGGGATYKMKTADETVNNSSSYQDDDHLTGFSVSANTDYIFTGVLYLTAGHDNPDLKLKFNSGDGVTVDHVVIAAHEGNDSSTGGAFNNADYGEGTALTTEITPDIDNAGNSVLCVTATIEVSGTGGTLDLQWAQNVAHSSDTVMLRGSWLRLEEIS